MENADSSIEVAVLIMLHGEIETLNANAQGNNAGEGEGPDAQQIIMTEMSQECSMQPH